MASAAPPAAAVGMPQFDLGQWPGQVVWALVVFGVLYLLLSRVFLPRLAGAIDAREDHISGALGEARRMRDEALARSEAAAGELAEAKGRARAVAEEAISQARADGRARRAEEDARLAGSLADADGEIATARDLAMTHVQQIAEGAAGAMVERLTGRTVTAEELARVRERAGAR